MKNIREILADIHGEYDTPKALMRVLLLDFIDKKGLAEDAGEYIRSREDEDHPDNILDSDVLADDKNIVEDEDEEESEEEQGPTAKEIADRIIANLPEKITLYYVDYREDLSKEQVQKLLESPSVSNDTQNEIEENYKFGSDYDSVKAYIREQYGVGLDDEELEILESDSKQYDRVREAIEERDDSTILQSLLKNTGSMFIRYRLRDDWADFPVHACCCHWDKQSQTTPEQLAEMFGLPIEQFRDQMVELLENAGIGGSPEIIWYGDVKDLYDKLSWDGPDENTWPINGTLTFHDPSILVMDFVNGAGHEVKLKGHTMTVPFDPSRLVIDGAKGTGYGWDETCGLVANYYKIQVDYNEGGE